MNKKSKRILIRWPLKNNRARNFLRDFYAMDQPINTEIEHVWEIARLMQYNPKRGEAWTKC